MNNFINNKVLRTLEQSTSFTCHKIIIYIPISEFSCEYFHEPFFLIANIGNNIVFKLHYLLKKNYTVVIMLFTLTNEPFSLNIHAV